MLPGLSNLSRHSFGITAPGFNPTDLFGASEAGIWMDPEVGVWQEVAESNLADTDGEVVGRWKDQSGNGHNFDQATTADKPLFKTAAGLSWIQFDGTNDYLSQAADVGLYDAATGYLAFAVDSANVGASKYFFGEGNSGSTVNFAYPLITSTTADAASADYRADMGVAKINSANIFDDDAYKLDGKIVLEVIDTGTNFEVFVDGVSGDGVNNDFAYTRGTTTLNQSAIGALLRTTVALFANFDCYGLVAIGRAVTAQERTDTRTFLNGRLGI